MRKLISTSILLLILASCATVPLPPIGNEKAFVLKEDEERLWKRSEDEERNLDNSGRIYQDQDVTAYLNEIVSKLIPEEVKSKGLSIKVRVINNPLLNAFAYPNGVIYVHTGILARMESESQLATLLGHEMTHITHRHTIQELRSVKKTTSVLAVVQVAMVPFGVYGDIVTLIGSVGTVASVTGYSRELESEADKEGLDLMVKAGYDPEEATKLFEHIKKDLEEEKIKEPFFFGSHPRIQERIDSYSLLLKTKYEGVKGEKGTERFVEKVYSLILDNARADLSMGRFSSSERAIERYLKVEPESAKGHYYLGEVFRQKGGEGDLEKAEAEYTLAARYDPEYPDPHKMLGLLYYKEKRWEEARIEMEKYLFLAPNAKDRSYIEGYLKEVDGK